ncbi:DNA repair protein RadA family protein [Flavobacterium suncheonense]|uniref:AAA+ ATPase domain-containing protein n=1 Tax=Flavobacterium suncheonense GH29-5 = DSM 17707 TaxID=1121899 RepID=A0A0A2MNB3_9FLAO|nr:hypothetical protein [Flavobacterium suncheonense]KGO89765.1 hypothetical protein Q764_06145 [Flavobacterium suncheonense GH29-5 = DSM 17707]
MQQPKKIKRAVSVAELKSKKFKTIPLSHEFKKLIGTPEDNGVWIVWGNSGHGKSRFLMLLAKELARHGKVIYDTLEEGARLSMQKNVLDTGMDQDENIMKNFLILNREPIEELKVRLRRKKHPRFVFIDSFQYTGLTKRQYIELKEEFTDVLFIINSHAEGKEPLGNIAKFVRYDADVKIRVEGFKAFPGSRFGGGEPLTIWEEEAAKYWMDLKQ